MKLIQKRAVKRDYGFIGNEVIVDHPKHGRLLITDGYGEDGLNGGSVRWKHGYAIKLLPNDTFESLEEPWNDTETILSAAIRCYDPKRQILPWNGKIIEKMMENKRKWKKIK